jgi:hypothetical protein
MMTIQPTNAEQKLVESGQLIISWISSGLGSVDSLDAGEIWDGTADPDGGSFK